MVVGEELRSGCDPVDHFLCKQIRLYRGNPVSLDAFHIIQLPDEFEECLACSLSEISGVHSCDDDLLYSFCSYGLGLRYDPGNRDVAAFTSGIWNRTVMAFVIASVLNLQE